jgi:hypothetical protein
MWCGRHDVPSCPNCTWDLYNSISIVKKGLTILPFPNPTHAKMKRHGKWHCLWHDEDIIVCK